MDWILIGFFATLAIALAVAIGFAIDRDRALDATRAALTRSSLGLSPLPPGSSVARDGSGTDVARRIADEARDHRRGATAPSKHYARLAA